jgi:hypothetical protein
MREFPAPGALCIEDWMAELANARGLRVVVRPGSQGFAGPVPGRDVVADEELVVALCQLQGLDRPQLLRLAAQCVSAGRVDVAGLIRLAVRERAELVLAELARQALKVDPAHPVWSRLLESFRDEPPPREPLLHWTRLARARPVAGRYNAESWELVA